MNLFYQPAIQEGADYLDEEESRHCIKVLRQKKGDQIRLIDGKGNFYTSVITDDSPKKCQFAIIDRTSEPTRTWSVHIAVSPTKNADRIEWFVEKAVEIGVDRITLMNCDHTERMFTKADRLSRLAISAMKQSLKATLPVIEGLTPFHDLVHKTEAPFRYIAWVDETNPLHLMDVPPGSGEHLILIGPEGDFSLDEQSAAMAQQFRKVSLGPSRLRTETAALAACHILNLINR